MFSPTIIVGILVVFHGSSVNSYTIGRAQDYPSHYSASLTIKDQEPATSSYPTSSPSRYTPVYSSSPSSATYQDASQAATYAHPSSEALNSLSSYQTDTSTDLNPYQSNQNIEYSSQTASPSFAGYSQSSENYSPPSNAYSPAQLGLSAAKTAYTGAHAVHNSPYSSNSNINYVPGAHGLSASASASSSGPAIGGSSQYHGYSSFAGRHPGPSYPHEHAHPSYSDSHRLSSPSLKNFMSSLHRESPGSYHSASGHHPNYLHSLQSATYAKPNPYFGGFNKSGGKIIIIKDSSGMHAVMQPEGSFSNLAGMLASSGYKVRSSGPGHFAPVPGHHYGGYREQGYPGSSGHSGSSGTSYFGYS